MYKESFYEYKEVNKAKINQKLVEATYLQVIHRFEKEKKMDDFPKEFRQNEMKWAGLMMRNKKLQKIMAEFTDRVSRVLEDEIRGNQQLIKDWVSYPHSHNTSPDGRNQLQIEQLEHPVWYPDNPPSTQKYQTAHLKQRAHLNKLANENKERK